MTQIEQIKAEIERIDRECQGKQYYIPARQKLDELRTFIDSLEKDEAPKRRLRDVPSWIAEVKAERGHEDEILQKRLEELRRIRAEKNRLDEAAENVRSRVKEIFDSLPKFDIDEERHNRVEFSLIALEAFALLFYQVGAEWMAGQGVSLSHLIAWYIQSVDAHEPVWTKEHLEELVKDYILIPKK